MQVGRSVGRCALTPVILRVRAHTYKHIYTHTHTHTHIHTTSSRYPSEEEGAGGVYIESSPLRI